MCSYALTEIAAVWLTHMIGEQGLYFIDWIISYFN